MCKYIYTYISTFVCAVGECDSFTTIQTHTTEKFRSDRLSDPGRDDGDNDDGFSKNEKEKAFYVGNIMFLRGDAMCIMRPHTHSPRFLTYRLYIPGPPAQPPAGGSFSAFPSE